MLADFWGSIPGIIKEAATSPLGIFALMIVALAILAFFFFKDAGTKVKLAIFLLLFLGVAVFAAKVVYKANQVAASESSATPSQTITPVPIPGDTGWIFAGYIRTQHKQFVEGPYVELVGTSDHGLRQFIEIGDTVRLRVSRPVIIVGYKTTNTSRVFESPTVVGVITSDDQTGVTLPKGTELIVRDVGEGQAPNNPNAALWLRVVHVPK
jgi:hypothetical protein